MGEEAAGRAGHNVVTKKLPGWIDYADGKLVLNAEKAAVVQRIFALAIGGLGIHSIAVTLNAENVPTMGRLIYLGREVKWNETVVYHVLKSGATHGEY